jgi:hypothetical protein
MNCVAERLCPMTFEIDSHFCFDASSNPTEECPKCHEQSLIKDKVLRNFRDSTEIQGWEVYCSKCGIRGTIINN